MHFFQDEEINEIKDLIGSAILDSDVEGGLRWPLGKNSSGGRYVVSSIGHTTAKSYRNSSVRFKFRHADRFDFKSSIGEVSPEIFLKMPGIISQLRVGSLSLTSNYVSFCFLSNVVYLCCMHQCWSGLTGNHIIVFIA